MINEYREPSVPAIRLLPMSEKDLEFTGKSIQEVQSWFKTYLPGQKYQFKRKMDTPVGSLVLFQFRGRLIASAILEEAVSYDTENPHGYRGYYRFLSSSIAVFDPLDFNDVQEIWGNMISFNQSSQRLDAAELPALKELLARRNFRFVECGEDDYQKAIEEIEIEEIEIEDEPKELFLNVIAAPEKLKLRRDPAIAKRALVQAGHKCEVDDAHEFFVSAKTGENYVEAHHLIPLEFQNEFGNSLDVEANIISLCALCHKKIHHAKENEIVPMIEVLYEMRKSRLGKCGLAPNIESLMDFY